MKGMYLLLSVVLLAAMVLFPLLAIPGETLSPGGDSGSSGAAEPDEALTNEKADHFLLYDPATQKTQRVDAVAYVVGVVAAEMPAAYEPEALKAQAVAAYTFACRKRALRLCGKATQDYDLTTESQRDQAYLTDAALREKWGEQYQANHDKIRAAVEAVAGYLLTWQGSPIFAAYHAVSGGKTESAANVWGTNFPYLQPVESVGDLLCPQYLGEVKVSADEFREALKDLCTLSGDAAGWVGEITCSDSGTVLTCPVGGQALTGAQLRDAFGLRSANFDLRFTDGGFTFTTRGNGHGVGMSQYGANYMALQGSDFLEILSWYYPGCTLEK